MGKDLGDNHIVQELTGKAASLKALAENRAATQFGGDKANPHHSEASSNKPWSYRNSLRDMSHRKMDDGDNVDAMTEAEIIKKILPTKTPTLVQIGAARELAKLAKGTGNPQFITDQLDGKLANTNINAGLAEIMRMSDDELDAIIASDDDTEAAESGGEGGENPQDTGAGTAQEPDE